MSQKRTQAIVDWLNEACAENRAALQLLIDKRTATGVQPGDETDPDGLLGILNGLMGWPEWWVAAIYEDEQLKQFTVGHYPHQHI